MIDHEDRGDTIRTVENQSQVEGEAHLVGVVEVAAGHNIRVVGTSVMMRI